MCRTRGKEEALAVVESGAAAALVLGQLQLELEREELRVVSMLFVGCVLGNGIEHIHTFLSFSRTYCPPSFPHLVV